MPDIETVRAWTRPVVAVAAVGVTLFPVLYAISAKWYKSRLGRAIMLKAVILMISVDFYAVYQYWAFTSNIYFLVWFRLCMYALIGFSGFYMTLNLIRYNYRYNSIEETDDVGQQRSTRP